MQKRIINSQKHTTRSEQIGAGKNAIGHIVKHKRYLYITTVCAVV